MTPAEWRALIEAFLDDRLSAEAFARRFLEAWRAARDRAEPAPAAIQRLAAVVEAYSPTARAGHPFEATSAQLRAGAQDALFMLDADSGAPHTYDRARARDEWRRLRMQVGGCTGLGCIIGIAWLGLCALQVFAVSDQIQHVLGWSAAPATLVGLFLAFVPVLGNVLAFYGARDVWTWDPVVAAVVFFAAPAMTLISGWVRWRRYGQ